MDQYIGEIRCFGFNFAPVDWAACDGRLLPIASFTALYAILGTEYGGDGVTSFALPDLRGRAPMHWGNGSSGFNTTIGQPLGSSTETLTDNQMPRHFHTISSAKLETGGSVEESPDPNLNGQSYLGQAQGGFIYQPPPATPDTAFAANAVSLSGSSQGHQNMQPSLVANYYIATDGIFPTRN